MIFNLNNCFRSIKYDYEIGRFNSVDPLWEKYTGWTGYQYSLNNPVNASDGNGKYFKFDNVSKDEENQIKSSISSIKLSQIGNELIEKLESTNYPIDFVTGFSYGRRGGVFSPDINEKNEIIYIKVFLDLTSATLSTVSEELAHVEQYNDAKDKKSFISEVREQKKKYKYDERPVEREAKNKASIIINEVNDRLRDLKGLPKIQFNQLPSEK